MNRATRNIGCLLIGLWTIFPIACVLAATAIAEAFGCQVDEGGVRPCTAFGRELGEQLHTMFVMGWFSFLTIPSGVVAGLIFLGVAWFSRRGR